MFQNTIKYHRFHLKNRITFLLLSICVFNGFSQSNTSKSNPPNIIYILADDLGIGDLSIYNENSKINTLYLDQMGREGMQFTDAHTSSSVCTPTRYGIITGRYNWRTPLKQFVLWGNSPMLIKENRLTVAQLLKEKGYQTANIGKWHLGLNWAMKNGAQEFESFSDIHDKYDLDNIDYTKPLKKGVLDLGFDYSFAISASLNMPPYVYLENDEVVQLPNAISVQKRKTNPYSHWIKGAISDDFKHEQVLPVLVDKANNYIKEKAKDKNPFFLYLPLPAPHNPIVPIEPWKGKSNINPYADFVLMIDDLMGELFKTIKESGIEQNTLVIFTSDNGCATNANFSVLKEKGHNPNYIYSGSKGSYLEGGHRVPFLVKWPAKIKANTISEATICTTDFMATCADIVDYDLKDNEAEDSYTMLPLLLQEEGYQREATIHHSKTGIFAIRKGDWKLIVSPNSGLNANGKPEKLDKELPENILYNLKLDIEEHVNVAEKYPEKVKELKQLLIKQINEGRSTPGEAQKNDTIAFPWQQAAFALDISKN
ncbi:arylsulfatase [Lacinutrix sp. C3R15]|uniref:sulfatase family protein n=1 Tax=Flavobacteriaceae TaxID=49546 RepID=UPI001C088A51|nr:MULTISPECIES: arylsulfatase [Flavobacteriaceae]MBU2939205.1 arylsulfatase [Lacinutrix sp. C3R15]MDO6622521.1 arylsulfatase [Oceanihabitans sp. 1_MG-2023]